MKKTIVLFLILLLFTIPSMAHIIPYELDKPDTGTVFWKYLGLGYKHIIPLGFDHILFILCVFFLNTGIKQIILQASMFTLAHSITLGLAAYGVINPSAALVEPIIALSIVLLALENIYSSRVKPWRMLMIFLFGLVHGMGFASALSEFGLPRQSFAEALLSFNIGVELGQISIILFMYLLVAKNFSHKWWYRRRLVIPSSVLIASVAAWWTIQRIF
jgi:HupE / UreJ protein